MVVPVAAVSEIVAVLVRHPQVRPVGRPAARGRGWRGQFLFLGGTVRRRDRTGQRVFHVLIDGLGSRRRNCSSLKQRFTQVQ